MCRFFSNVSLSFCERRLLFFALEKGDIPFPSRYEEFENTLELRREERDAFRRAYRKSLETLPAEPTIVPEVLCTLSDDEANRVFGALESEGVSPEDVLLLRARRRAEQGLKSCKQQVHEQMLLVNALKDVSTAQGLVHDYMREQTARENLGDNPEQRKSNRAKASALLNVISEIGNGNCIFPLRAKEESGEETEGEREKTDEERSKRMEALKAFHYDCIRDCEELRDDRGNLVLSMPLMRSLASLHLRFNNLHVDRAMDTQSIALAEHAGQELLALARDDLDPAKCKPLLCLSEELHADDEPIAGDFEKYPVMIEKLPAVPKLILTLLHKDIVAAHPLEREDKEFGRADLVDQYRKGGNIVTDTERAVLMRELIEYLADYTEALAEAGETGEKTHGFTVRNAFLVYRFLRENARKYLFQSGVDFLYLTGSNHGVKHLIQGDVRFGTQVAEKLTWSARDRVCLRQIAANHDLGYTHAALQLFNMQEDGIPLNNGYYGLVKDHPLYSSALFEVHRPEYEEYFGREAARNIGLSVLDHSEVKGHLRDEDSVKRIQALFCRMDCLAVSADLKAAPAFMHDKVLVAMSKALEAAEYLKGIDKRMEDLWKEDKVRSDEYKWLVAAQASLRTIAGKVKRYLLGLNQEIYEDRVLQQAYHHAIDQHYDRFNPTFPTQRDFGSNAISFAGIDVHVAKARDHITVRLDVQPLFFAVADYFGEEQGPRFATSAIQKVFEDFGGVIHDPSMVVMAFKELSRVSEGPFPGKDIEKRSDGGMECAQQHATHVHFEFAMTKLGESSPLIKLMTKLRPSLRMVRQLMELEFDTGQLQSLFREIAHFSRSKKLTDRVKAGDWEGATEYFLSKHFTLPK